MVSAIGNSPTEGSAAPHPAGPARNAAGEVAAGVVRVPIIFVNAYLVDAPAGRWVLVDTGLPGFAWRVRRAAEKRYGAGARPAAILLTHGHFDHAGSALELARAWDTPVYAHRLELPYLTGRSDYPPQDPTMGGAIAQMSRVFPHHGYDLGRHVRELPADGSVPELPGWRWLHTPGHSPGHVSLWRSHDRTLLAGDAFATMNLDSWTAQVTHARELSRPPAPFTPDWRSAGRSVERLAALAPVRVAAGHGRALSGAGLPARLRRFAAMFEPPSYGRYVGRPAHADASGVTALPPPVPDPLLGKAVAATTAAVAIAALLYALQRREHNAQVQSSKYSTG